MNPSPVSKATAPPGVAAASSAAGQNATGSVPGVGPMLAGWRRLRTLTTSLSQGLDAVIDGILQDNDVVVVVDKPQCFAEDDAVLPHTTTFRARNKVLVPGIRKAFTLLCVVGMVVWLLVDIFYQDANGLVPGLRDTYIIDSKPFDPNEQLHQDAGTTSVCTCTYSTASTAYGQPPYVSLVLNKNHKPPAFDTYLGFCDEPERGQAMFNFSGPDGKLLKSVLNEYFFHLSSLRVQAPTSAIMLPQEGWKAARMSEAQRGLHAATTAARFRLHSAAGHVLSEQQTQMGYFFVALLHTSFTKALGRLLDMPDSAVTVEMVNAATNTSVPLSCSKVPSRGELPLVLSEWCVPVPGQAATTADAGDVERNCGDPYAAYVQWCAPAVCHTLGPKTPYLQAVQIMSAIGGVYSIIAMFAFAIVWRGFCSLERQVNIDGLCCTTVRRLKAWLRCAAAAVCTACCCCTVQHAGSRSGGVGCAAGGVGSTQQQQQLGVQKGSVSMPQVKQQGGDALNGSDIV